MEETVIGSQKFLKRELIESDLTDFLIIDFNRVIPICFI